tara:strand:+ start:134 stop:499 length:366 start_codon:yes stop_codon:yes gene_type:complete
MSLGVALPLTLDAAQGYTKIKGLKKLIRQNLKMLVLTSPGERIMIPEYGVGIKKYLFSNFNESVYGEIQQNISEQVGIYLPVITIQNILFNASSPDTSTLGIKIIYSVPELGFTDNVDVTI